MPVVIVHSGILPKIMKSKMADASSDILLDSVRFILSNWTVVQLAVEHGFGGRDTAEKAEWMVNVINQVLRENGKGFHNFFEGPKLTKFLKTFTCFLPFYTSAGPGNMLRM